MGFESWMNQELQIVIFGGNPCCISLRRAKMISIIYQMDCLRRAFGCVHSRLPFAVTGSYWLHIDLLIDPSLVHHWQGQPTWHWSAEPLCLAAGRRTDANHFYFFMFNWGKEAACGASYSDQGLCGYATQKSEMLAWRLAGWLLDTPGLISESA